MIKAVISDDDGMVADTIDIHAEVWQRAFKDFGEKLEFSVVRAQIGKDSDQLMMVFLMLVFLSEKEFEEIGEKTETDF